MSKVNKALESFCLDVPAHLKANGERNEVVCFEYRNQFTAHVGFFRKYTIKNGTPDETWVSLELLQFTISDARKRESVVMNVLRVLEIAAAQYSLKGVYINRNNAGMDDKTLRAFGYFRADELTNPQSYYHYI
jgi:hypothetical protein